MGNKDLQNKSDLQRESEDLLDGLGTPPSSKWKIVTMNEFEKVPLDAFGAPPTADSKTPAINWYKQDPPDGGQIGAPPGAEFPYLSGIGIQNSIPAFSFDDITVEVYAVPSSSYTTVEVNNPQPCSEPSAEDYWREMVLQECKEIAQNEDPQRTTEGGRLLAFCTEDP